MTKRIISATVAFCAVASMLVAGASAQKTTYLYGDCDREIEFTGSGISEQTAEYIADVILSPDTDWEEPCAEHNGESEYNPADVSGTDYGESANHKPSHKTVRTTAYYTEHLVYDKDPRCRTYALDVVACTVCGYIHKTVIWTARVMSCHPTSSSGSRGDVNGDGKVNSRDVLLVMQRIIRPLPKGTKFNFTLADVNNDKKINSRDVLAIMKLALSS